MRHHGAAMHRAGILGAMTIVLAIASACVPEPAWLPERRPGRVPPRPRRCADPPRLTPAGPTPTPAFIRPTPTPGPSFTTYKVKKGDTIVVDRARSSRRASQSIAYWNRVTYPSLDPESAKYRPDRLEVGWVLQRAAEPGGRSGERCRPSSPKPTPHPRERRPVRLAPSETPATRLPGPRAGLAPVSSRRDRSGTAASRART